MPFTKEQLRAYWKAEVSPNQVSHLEVSQETSKVSPNQVSQMANLSQVSRESSPGKPENGKPFLAMANPKLTQLIHQYQTNTNYSCAPGCNENKYCSNCWCFSDSKLIDYKEVSM
jgi:hypothetical protein